MLLSAVALTLTSLTLRAGIAECELLKWFVTPGQQIKQFDKVCEVQSDKANVEITSRYDGVVTKLHCEGNPAYGGMFSR